MAKARLFHSQTGQDVATGQARFTFGFSGLIDGIGLVPLVMGLFGVSEVLLNLEKIGQKQKIIKTSFRVLFPGKEDWKRSVKPIGKKTLI